MTKQEILKEATKKTLNIIEGSPLHDAVMVAMDQYVKSLFGENGINKNWTKPQDGFIDVPDCLMPLFNRIGNQIRFHTISGKNEILTVAHILEASREFFSRHPELLDNGQSCKNKEKATE